MTEEFIFESQHHEIMTTWANDHVHSIPGLVCVARTDKSGKTYLVFKDDNRIKWKILPHIAKRKRMRAMGPVVCSFELYHRSSRATSVSYHHQGKSGQGSLHGLDTLLWDIKSHEQYEKGEEERARKQYEKEGLV